MSDRYTVAHGFYIRAVHCRDGGELELRAYQSRASARGAFKQWKAKLQASGEPISISLLEVDEAGHRCLEVY